MNPLIQPRGALYLVALMAICTLPFALAQRNPTKQSVAKLGSASKRLVGVGNAPASIIVVTNTNDSGPGSLRDALSIANDGDTIDATGVSGTILLTSGELQINHNVTINGPGAANLAVNGNNTYRVFESFASNVTISGLTITNGRVDDDNGGGILNHGGLTLSDSSIISNHAVATKPYSASGGGIASSGGTLAVTNSVISSNGAASGDGGGIIVSGGGTLTVTNSVISGNIATDGGGISSDGATVTVSESSITSNGDCFAGGGIRSNNTQLTVMNSTISGNSSSGACNVRGAGLGGGLSSMGSGSLTVINSTISGNSVAGPGGEGGGVYNSGGMLTVTNSTISGNEVDPMSADGGGVANYGNLTVSNSTISSNSAPAGGSILNGNGGVTQIGDTILNAGTSGGTILNSGGTVTSLGYNLASDDGGGVLTGPGDQINTDPVLGPLQDNGGPTFTHALLSGSPAIDAGDPNFTPPPFFDQRSSGFNRVVNGRIDIGSFEVQVPRASPTPRPRPSPRPRP